MGHKCVVLVALLVALPLLLRDPCAPLARATDRSAAVFISKKDSSCRKPKYGARAKKKKLPAFSSPTCPYDFKIRHGAAVSGAPNRYAKKIALLTLL